MNYLINQIANFERCNVGIPVSLVRKAAADVIASEWGDAAALKAAVVEGSFDYDGDAESLNAILEQAGCRTRVSVDDVVKGLAIWLAEVYPEPDDEAWEEEEIAPGNKINFDTLLRAAKAGHLTVAACRWKLDGRRVDVVCAVSHSRGVRELVPLATMFMGGEPYDLLDPPTRDTLAEG